MRSADGSGKQTVLSPDMPTDDPAVCGRYLVVDQVDVAKAQVNLFRFDLDGGGRKQLTFGRYNGSAACSPDGALVAYVSSDSGKRQILRLPIDGGQPQRLSDLEGDRPAFSPDGKLLLFRNNEGNSPQTFQHRTVIIPAAGGAPLHILINDPRTDAPRSEFTPDGKGFAYVATEGDVSNIWIQPLAGGHPQQMTFFKSERINDFSFSRDGKKLAILRGRTNRDVVLIRDTGQ